MGQSQTQIAQLLTSRGVKTSRHSVARFLKSGLQATTKDPFSRQGRQEALKVVSKNDIVIPKPSELIPWGLGGPDVLKLPKKQGSYTVVGIFDLHGEFREEKLFQAQLELVRDLQPDLVVLGGDTDNFDIISRWQHKLLSRMSPLQIHKAIRKEIDEGKRIRERVREVAGSATVIEVEGNHGDRLRKYLSDDLQEGWETSIEWRGLNETLDHYYNRAGVFIRPDFLVRHGATTAQYPAAKEFRDCRCSGWTGHLHTVHAHFEPPFHLKNERYIHTIAPASCRLDYNYGPGNANLARWYQGCLVGSFNAKNPHDHVTDVGLWNGKQLRVRGELY